MVYTALSAAEFGLGLTQVLSHDPASPGVHAIPPALLQTTDYLWFLCLPLTTHCLPEAQQLAVRISLHEDGAGAGAPAARPEPDLRFTLSVLFVLGMPLGVACLCFLPELSPHAGVRAGATAPLNSTRSELPAGLGSLGRGARLTP